MRIRIMVITLLLLTTHAWGAAGGDDPLEVARRRCERMSAILEKAMVLKKARVADSEACAALKNEFEVSGASCMTALEMAREIAEELQTDDPAAGRQAYFDACIESESERIAKNPKSAAETGGPATAKDLHGAYVLLVQPEAAAKALNKVADPFGEKFQYFIFAEDGRFRYISADKEIGGVKSRKDVQEMVEVMDKLPGGTRPVSFRFLKDGFILLYDQAKPDFGMIWGANAVKAHRDSGKGIVWEPGDILLSLDKDGEPVYFKQLRPLPE